MRKIPFLRIFLLSIDVWVLADADPTPLPIGEKAPDFWLSGTDGKTWSLNDLSSFSVLVVVFTCNHYPAAPAYGERINGLASDYKSSGVGSNYFSRFSAISDAGEMGYF